MDIRNRRALKQAAAETLAATPNQSQIIALYAGGNLLAVLCVTLLDYLLDGMIAKTSGLSNMGSRMILQTIQTVLPILQTAALLFWDYGYISLILGISRRRSQDPRELVSGFRLLGPIFRLTLLQYAITFVVTFASVYLAMMVFMFSPFSNAISQALIPMMENAISITEMAADPAVAAAVSGASIPLLLILLVIYCALAVPVLYLFRMASYCLLDDPRAGALRALGRSRMMMRHNRRHLLKLDLSFWWYYLLSLVPMAICYGDWLLPMLGISLPMSETASYFLFYGLYIVAQFLYSYFFQNQVEVTYAYAYEALIPPPPPQPEPQQNGVVLGNIFQM